MLRLLLSADLMYQDAENQVATLTAAREGLLTGMKKLKEQHSALKLEVQKIDGGDAAIATSAGEARLCP